MRPPYRLLLADVAAGLSKTQPRPDGGRCQKAYRLRNRGGRRLLPAGEVDPREGAAAGNGEVTCGPPTVYLDCRTCECRAISLRRRSAYDCIEKDSSS